MQVKERQTIPEGHSNSKDENKLTTTWLTDKQSFHKNNIETKDRATRSH